MVLAVFQPLFHSFTNLFLDKSITSGDWGRNAWWSILDIKFELKFVWRIFLESISRKPGSDVSLFLLMSKLQRLCRPDMEVMLLIWFPASSRCSRAERVLGTWNWVRLLWLRSRYLRETAFVTDTVLSPSLLWERCKVWRFVKCCWKVSSICKIQT